MKMPRPGEDRSDVGGAAQFNNIGPVPLSPRAARFLPPSRFLPPASVPLSPPASRFLPPGPVPLSPPAFSPVPPSPPLTRTRAHHEEISGLNRTAFDLAVHAS